MSGMGMSMDMWGGSGGKPKQLMVQKMILAPRLRSKPLSAKQRKALFNFTGRTVRHNEVQNGNSNS